MNMSIHPTNIPPQPSTPGNPIHPKTTRTPMSTINLPSAHALRPIPAPSNPAQPSIFSLTTTISVDYIAWYYLSLVESSTSKNHGVGRGFTTAEIFPNRLHPPLPLPPAHARFRRPRSRI